MAEESPLNLKSRLVKFMYTASDPSESGDSMGGRISFWLLFIVIALTKYIKTRDSCRCSDEPVLELRELCRFPEHVLVSSKLYFYFATSSEVRMNC